MSSSADAACRLALALGLDVSGSVDASEYRLQLDGIAAALTDPDVLQAITVLPETPVALLVYEWSTPDAVRVLVPWRDLTDAAAVQGVIETLASTQRRPAPTATGIGAAMLTGAAFLAQRQDCWQKTLDLSGDGVSNVGPRPRGVRDDPRLAGITVNALVIGADVQHDADARQMQIAELTSYFRSRVIRGPDAFIEAALGYEDYARAMTRKLRRELQGIVLSRAAIPAQ